MPMQEQFAKELLGAMKSRDSVRMSTLRMLISALRNKEIEKQKSLAEADVLEVLQAEAKRRREAMEEYSKANRQDLASKEEAELNVLKIYLPLPLSESELKALIQAALHTTGAKSPQEMGRVMSILMPQIKGRADGKQAQVLVQQALSVAK